MKLTYRNYWELFRRTKWFLILFTLACVLAAALISQYAIRPAYEANASLFIYKSNQTPGREQIDLDVVQTNAALAPTYAALIKDPFIVDKVIAKLPELKLQPKELESRIKVSTQERSQILTISYKDNSFDVAKQIVNTIATVFKEEMYRVMEVDNIQILYTASTPNSDSVIKPSAITNSVIAAIMGLILSTLAVLVREYFQGSYRSEEEIIADLQVAVLGSVRVIKRKEFKSKPVSPYEESLKTRLSEVNYVEAR